MESKKRKALSDTNRLEIRKYNRTYPPVYPKRPYYIIGRAI